MHILVTGWFSFRGMGNSAGDMIALGVVCNWLKDAGISCDVAASDPVLFPESVNWQTVDPAKYSDVLFVCGPFGNGWPLTDLISRFAGCRLVGVNITLLEPLSNWNPFTILHERDSSVTTNPDITLYAPTPAVPVVGVIQITKQDEYGKRDMHVKANEAIEKFISSREMSVVRIDTVLENNKGGLKTAGEIEALIARMDVVITTRLHGTVLSLKNGVPVIPVDPVAGGAKITEQVRILKWPLLFNADCLDDKALSEAFSYCLTHSARQQANRCAAEARIKIEQLRKKMIDQHLALEM